jgi:glycerol-1-phosphate dehydrogenase [NAD(P)+]
LLPHRSAPPPPDDLPALRRWLEARPDVEQLLPIQIQEIVVASNALWQLPDVLRDLAAPRRLILAQDPTPMRRGADSLKPLVADVLRDSGYDTTVFAFPPSPDGQVHADLPGVALLRDAIGDEPATVVALGSGSVCDMAKQACHEADQAHGKRPCLVLVATATAVTAFTSNLSILLRDGVKRTYLSRYPDAVVCDLETLRDAPPAMTAAGLGDCCARFISYGDWYLSHQLGFVPLYSLAPWDMMGDDLDQAFLANGPAVAQGTLEGIAFVARQVLLAGLAQSVVRMTAPLSGTEHATSHVLDMGAHAWGRGFGLHGAQVGVATPLAAYAYELLLERFDPGRPRPASPDPTEQEQRVRAAFNQLDPSGRMATECWNDYGQKLAGWATAADRFDSVRERWDEEVAPELRRLVRPASTIRAILEGMGHPTRFADLTPSIPEEQSRFALANGHFMRKKFAVGDLLNWLKLGDQTLADDLLAFEARGWLPSPTRPGGRQS